MISIHSKKNLNIFIYNISYYNSAMSYAALYLRYFSLHKRKLSTVITSSKHVIINYCVLVSEGINLLQTCLIIVCWYLRGVSRREMTFTLLAARSPLHDKCLTVRYRRAQVLAAVKISQNTRLTRAMCVNNYSFINESH